MALTRAEYVAYLRRSFSIGCQRRESAARRVTHPPHIARALSVVSKALAEREREPIFAPLPPQPSCGLHVHVQPEHDAPYRVAEHPELGYDEPDDGIIATLEAIIAPITLDWLVLNRPPWADPRPLLGR